MNANLYSILRERFKSALKGVFLDMGDAGSVNYGEIDEQSARLATALVELGVAPGDRLMVQIPKSRDAVAIYLASLRIGAVYVPLNPGYTDAEVQYFIDDASPSLLIRESPVGVTARSVATPATLIALANSCDEQTEASECKPEDLAAMLYTSGTTGQSKGAMLTHGNLASNAQTLHEFWGFVDGDVLLHVLPIFHVHGLFVAIHTAMLNASTVAFLDRFTVDGVIENLPRCSVMMGVPTHYVRMLEDERFTQDLCKSMRLFTSGSAPMTEAVHSAFTARSGHRILERYGMTETGMISSNPYDGDRIAGTVGFSLPGVEVRVCDESGAECLPGQTGVVEVRGPNVFRGYWRLPDRTKAEHRADGFFMTGDVGFLDDDGRLTLEGRSSDMIISGGYNVYPKEVELAIDSIPGIVESAVVGVAHDDLGEIAVAVVVAEPGGPTAEIIAELISQKLARFKQPRSIVFVDALPRNAMGKVQKASLRDQFAGPQN